MFEANLGYMLLSVIRVLLGKAYAGGILRLCVAQSDMFSFSHIPCLRYT